MPTIKHALPVTSMLALLLAACHSPGNDQPGAARDPLPIEPNAVPSQVFAWPYRNEMQASLTGDNLQTIGITAQVELGANGEPLWEHGHRWAVYVEESDQERTLLYVAFVPNGRVDVGVIQADINGQRELLIVERTRHQQRMFTIRYDDPGNATLTSASYYQVEHWLSGSGGHT